MSLSFLSVCLWYFIFGSLLYYTYVCFSFFFSTFFLFFFSLLVDFRCLSTASNHISGIKNSIEMPFPCSFSYYPYVSPPCHVSPNTIYVWFLCMHINGIFRLFPFGNYEYTVLIAVVVVFFSSFIRSMWNFRCVIQIGIHRMVR